MDLNNKLCVITGANSGIGKAAAMRLAEGGAFVMMICRNEEKARSAREEIVSKTGNNGVEVIIADLQLQYDVRKAAEELKSRFDQIDLLINNAGIYPSDRQETPDGIERTLAINYLGHFLLTYLLADHLEASDQARVINVTSDTHRMAAPWFDLKNLMLEEGFTPFRAYAQSKLCNIMFARELETRTSGRLKSYAVHPGVVKTNLPSESGWLLKLSYFLGGPFMRSPEGGAEPIIYLSKSEEAAGQSGAYFKRKRRSKPAEVVLDEDKRRGLWERSKRLCNLE